MSENHGQTLLSDLRPGDEATVVDLAAEGSIKQQLMEMGFTRGVRIRVERYAPLGDPMELVVKGYHLSLRKEECQLIIINREA
jgi:Fe2+ transport system protein FeoA